VATPLLLPPVGYGATRTEERVLELELEMELEITASAELLDAYDVGTGTILVVVV